MVGVIVVASVSCTSGGKERSRHDPLDGNGHDAYVAAFESSNAEHVTESESQCVAETIVDSVGVDRLRDAATPRQIADLAADADASFGRLGVEIDAQQGDAIYAAVKGCVDLREQFVSGMAEGGGALPPAVEECFKRKLNDELLREIFITRLTKGDAGFATGPELTETLMVIGRRCAAS